MLRASPSTSFRLGRWRNPSGQARSKWDTGFSNYTHLKESFGEKLKFNEGWWVPRSAPHGETAMSEHLSEAILNHGKKDMEQRGLYPTKARRVDQVGARDRARAKPNETAC
jgi:hypothetical protein